MKISSISIGGLWNKYNIEWKLNDSVNILSGPNGAGKSTIVDAIRMLISEDKLIESKTNSVEINFDNDTTYGAIHFMDTVKELQKRQHESPAYLQLWSKVRKDLRNRPVNKSLEDIIDVIKESVDVIDVMKPIYNFKAKSLDETFTKK